MADDRWFHSFRFDDGTEIDGVIPYHILQKRVTSISSVDFHNKSVLDVGCWDGFFSIYAALQGARSVVGIDVGPWSNNEWERKFDYAVEKSGVKDVVRRKTLSLYEAYGSYDIVMFMGVLFHLKNPMFGF